MIIQSKNTLLLLDMLEKYTKAKFWKCALQVNPVGYIKYRGTNHGLSEEEYNQELVRIAKENNIKVIGLADHGNVDSIAAIRAAMEQPGIIVFPGFEIVSSEKTHFVCLFPENTTRDELIGYLAKLEIDVNNPTYPSTLSAEQILLKIEDLKGFLYAAHCTDDNGVLYNRLNHIWKNPLLKAAQIPGTLDELKNNGNSAFQQILQNKTPEYKRDTSIAIINAKDVAQPETLANPKASCLIKMTKPCFESFKLAFQDSESRVRLNSDISEQYYSRIESLKVTGGYLDGVNIDFSDHLNTVIGGRGTGKSTLLECIRFCLQLKPIGENAKKQHNNIIKENLGNSSKARVEIIIRSWHMNGRRFTIARTYTESASVKDEQGNISAFTPADLLPTIEIYGQNEIYEIAQDKSIQRHLLNRFLETEKHDSEKLQEILGKLAENRKKLLEAQENVASIEDEVARLPKLEEQLGQFKTLGLEEKLKIIPLLEMEKRLQKRAAEEESQNLDKAFQSVRDCLPDTVFLSDSAINNLPHSGILKKLRTVLDDLRIDVESLLNQWESKYADTKTKIVALNDEFNALIQQEELKLEKYFKELPTLEGKAGKEIGIEFQNLLKEIERIRPKKTLIDNRKNVVTELSRQRKAILDELSALRAERSAQFERVLKSLNKRLSGKLKLTVKPEAERQPIIDFLLSCRLEGVGEGRLAWIRDVEDFSPVKLAELIRLGSETIRNCGWAITPTVADALARINLNQILQLEELELPDIINIELNVAHEGQENYRPLDKLSTGQQCTAILHLLLLQNLDPLLMDQPEDNLDNAFIADRIVTELRSAKIGRQFIFATHNANIPVFGDAEWIGVFDVQDSQAYMPTESQGGIDDVQVRDKAANILEGGKTAFNQRKAKYGY